MYLERFELQRLPFETVSNGQVYVDLPMHRDAMNTLLFALRAGEGFVKVVGEVGTGKTALCRRALEILDEEFVTAYVSNPALPPLDLLRTIAEELGCAPSEEATLHALHRSLRAVLLDAARVGGRVVILVDEAQSMPEESLEQLRLLSNLESTRGRLLQVALFGQPELDDRLRTDSLRQLQQRIAFSARLVPLDRIGCSDYVQGRLDAAGSPNPAHVFTRAAIEEVRLASAGLPRLVNVLCHKSLMAAYSDRSPQVGTRHVLRAVADTEGLERWQTRPIVGRRSSILPPHWRRLGSSFWGGSR